MSAIPHSCRWRVSFAFFVTSAIVHHVVPQILEALLLAVERDLRLPLLYNTSAYDSLDSLRLTDGIVDIYMPEFKFRDPERARRSAKAPDCPETARSAIKEMHRQVGPLVIHERGIALRSVLLGTTIGSGLHEVGLLVCRRTQSFRASGQF